MTPDQEKFVNAMGNTFAASHQRTHTFIRTLHVAESAQAADRLRDVTDLLTSYVDAGEQVLRRRPQGDTDP